MRWLALLLAFVLAAPARAAVPPLLDAAVQRWVGERNRWAFVQQVTEYDGAEVKQTRLENYDPSRSYERRWLLLKIDGRRPTSDEWDAWMKRKNKKKKFNPRPPTEYLDLEHARQIDEDARIARFQLPLRSSVQWLFPVDKIELTLTIDKTSGAIERADAAISEPFKVAMGLARILNFDLDLNLQPPAGPAAAEPAAAKPSGSIRAVVTKFGQRVEYRWSDFKRVTPHPSFASNADASGD